MGEELRTSPSCSLGRAHPHLLPPLLGCSPWKLLKPVSGVVLLGYLLLTPLLSLTADHPARHGPFVLHLPLGASLAGRGLPRSWSR